MLTQEVVDYTPCETTTFVTFFALSSSGKGVLKNMTDFIPKPFKNLPPFKTREFYQPKLLERGFVILYQLIKVSKPAPRYDGNSIQLSATDVLAPTSMKNAAKCDT